MNRSGWLALAWLATAVGSGFAAAWFLRAPPREVVVERTITRAPSVEPPSLEGRGSRSEIPPGMAATHEPTKEAAKENSQIAEPGTSGWIEVTVLQADGSPATGGATVHATPLDTGGQVSTAVPSEVSADDSGLARVPVAAAGTYRLGAVWTPPSSPSDHDRWEWRTLWLRASEREVRVSDGETARQELKLPAIADLVVRIEGFNPDHTYRVETDDGDFGRTIYDNPQGVLRVAAGIPIHLTARESSHGGGPVPAVWVAEPGVVTAPGSVVFHRIDESAKEDAAASVSVTFQFEVRGSVPSGLDKTHLQLTADGVDSHREFTEEVTWNDGKPWIAPQELKGVLPIRLAWSGTGAVPGEMTVPAAGKADSHAVVAIVAFDAAALPGIEGIDIEGGPGVRGRGFPEHSSAFAWDPADPSSTVQDSGGGLSAFPPGWKAIVRWGAWWASDTVTLPARGRVKFRMVPAGYLMLVMPRPPVPSLGELSIRRADGAWLEKRSSEEIARGYAIGRPATGLGAGSLLGPIPDGDVELIVSQGGVDRTRVVGHVKANRITPLEITW